MFFVVEASSDGSACFSSLMVQRMGRVSLRLTCGVFLLVIVWRWRQLLQQTLLKLKSKPDWDHGIATKLADTAERRIISVKWL